MVVGRFLGWFLVILAIVMASAEAVMALGTGAYSGLATADVWTLLVGHAPITMTAGVLLTDYRECRCGAREYVGSWRYDP